MTQLEEHPAAPAAPPEIEAPTAAAADEAAALANAPPSTNDRASEPEAPAADTVGVPATVASAPVETDARSDVAPPPRAQAPAPTPPAPSASEAPAGKNELLSDNDLMSALASLESLPKAEVEKIPSLSADEPAAKAGGGKRFKIPPKGAAGAAPAAAAPQADGAPAAPAEAVASGPIVLPKLGIGKRVYRAFDWVLATINRPFSFLPAGVRAIVGGFALTTIVVNGAWIVLQPMLFSPRDAVTYLQERRALLDHPPAAADTGHGESDDGHGKPAKDDHGKKPATDEHGKKPAKDDQGKKPAKDDHGKKPAKDDHGKKPSKDDHGKKPAKDDHGKKPAKPKEHAKKDDHGKPDKKAAKGDKKKKGAEKSSGHH